MSKRKRAGIIIACIISIIVLVGIAASCIDFSGSKFYTLTITISPSGAGSVSPSASEYQSGTQATLTASPAIGYTFDHWGGSASGTASTITITMDSDKSVTAYFEAAPGVLFSDDFSDESSGWDTFDVSNGQAIYRDGYFYMKDYTDDWTIYSESQHYFTDFVLEAETWLAGGTDDNWYGVMCRYMNSDNFYAFLIRSDGRYGIEKAVDGNRATLIEPTYSSYINQGMDAVNLIHIACIGSSLSLSVNGHLLATVTDDSFTDGDIALVADAVGGTFTEVAFDNIIVTEPEVLFSDDFSDESSGWNTANDSYGQIIYRDGYFYIKDYTDGLTLFSRSHHYFTDFILEVETWLVDGTDNTRHVLYYRYSDVDNHYGFSISADGYYRVWKEVDNYITSLVGLTYSSYINQGVGAVNLIHIACIGSSLSLSVNGHLLWEGTDATFTGGDIALGAAAEAGTFTEVAFDNIIVYSVG